MLIYTDSEEALKVLSTIKLSWLAEYSMMQHSLEIGESHPYHISMASDIFSYEKIDLFANKASNGTRSGDE